MFDQIKLATIIPEQESDGTFFIKHTTFTELNKFKSKQIRLFKWFWQHTSETHETGCSRYHFPNSKYNQFIK